MKFSQALVAIALTSTATSVAAQDTTTTSELVAELIETEQELVKEETVLEGMIRNITELSNQTEIVPLVAELEEELQPGVTEPTVTLTAAPEDMVVMDAHVDTPEEPIEQTAPVSNSLIDGTSIAHEESAHQHKKSERMRAKAGKGHKIDDEDEDELLHEVVDESDTDEPSMTTKTVDMNAKTHKEAVGPNAKSYKAAEPSMSYVVTTSKASKHSKATHDSKSSKSGHGSLSLEMEEVMPDSDDMSMPTSPGASKAHKSSKAKSAKRGKVQDHSMSMVTSMDEIDGVGQVLRGGKSHKGTVETATDATDYVEYTEAPDLEEEEEAPSSEEEEEEEEEEETTPLIGSLPEPGQEDNEDLLEGETGVETQPVVRTPDMKPKSGTSTSDLNKKYQQEVKDGMLHDNGSNSNPTHNQKENVGTLDLNGGESKLQNGAQMADVASGASSISSSSVILGGICLMVSAVYAMAV